ncbi:mucin-4-like [Diprion similis]|uniref:mucin-4-like n=1 Tax=Diprion similis TaxID=362088 RepID=UPI001EF774CD|nr:mucin-4-like [Diprion similis]
MTGDRVLKRHHTLSSGADRVAAKLTKRFTGPFIITNKISPTIYELKSESGKSVKQENGKRKRESRAIGNHSPDGIPPGQTNTTDTTHTATTDTRTTTTPTQIRTRRYRQRRHTNNTHHHHNTTHTTTHPGRIHATTHNHTHTTTTTRRTLLPTPAEYTQPPTTTHTPIITTTRRTLLPTPAKHTQTHRNTHTSSSTTTTPTQSTTPSTYAQTLTSKPTHTTQVTKTTTEHTQKTNPSGAATCSKCGGLVRKEKLHAHENTCKHTDPTTKRNTNTAHNPSTRTRTPSPTQRLRDLVERALEEAEKLDTWVKQTRTHDQTPTHQTQRPTYDTAMTIYGLQPAHTNERPPHTEYTPKNTQTTGTKTQHHTRYAATPKTLQMTHTRQRTRDYPPFPTTQKIKTHDTRQAKRTLQTLNAYDLAHPTTTDTERDTETDTTNTDSDTVRRQTKRQTVDETTDGVREREHKPATKRNRPHTGCSATQQVNTEKKHRRRKHADATQKTQRTTPQTGEPTRKFKIEKQVLVDLARHKLGLRQDKLDLRKHQVDLRQTVESRESIINWQSDKQTERHPKRHKEKQQTLTNNETQHENQKKKKNTHTTTLPFPLTL